MKVKGGVSEDTLYLFLHYMYGCNLGVLEVREISTLAELHSTASQFGQVELENGVKERLRGLLDKEISRGPVAVMEVNFLLARRSMEELLLRRR